MLYIIILSIVIMETVAQYFIRKYHELPYPLYYVLGVIFYAVVAYLLHTSYNYTTMGMSQILWSGCGVVSVLLVGSLFFGETIEMNEWVGMIFILAGLLITQIKNFV